RRSRERHEPAVFLGEESVPARHKHLCPDHLLKEPIIPRLGLSTRPIHLRRPPHRHRLLRLHLLQLTIIITGQRKNITAQDPPEIRPHEKPSVAALHPPQPLLLQESRHARVPAGQARAVFGKVGVEEGAVVEERGPAVLGDGRGPGEEGDGLEGARHGRVVLGEEDAGAEAVAGEVFGHADVEEAWVDQVRGVDCEDRGEGDGGSVGRGAVDGHGVDFVGDEVDVMALAEAHNCPCPRFDIVGEAGIQRPSDKDAVALVGDSEANEIDDRGHTAGYEKMLGEYLLDGFEVVVKEAAECGSQGAGAKGPVAKRSHIDLLELRDSLTSQLSETPYSYVIYLKRAQCHGDLGYPDLGAGDAYRALLLIDEISDDSGEYHEQAVETLQNHLARGSSIKGNTERKYEGENDPCEQANDAGQEDSSLFLSPESLNVYNDRLFCFALLSRSLTQCGCLRSAYDFAERGLGYSPSDSQFLNLRSQILETYKTTLLVKDRHCGDCNFSTKAELPEQVYSRRELYPWNHHEPDRFSDESLRSLDGQIKKLAPKCEIRSVELPVLEAETSNTSFRPSTTTKQLGIFATEDIAPHETVLRETSILTANNRLHDPLCDACSAPLPSISSSLHTPLPTCPECDDIIFCSPACHSAAISLYHPAVCGKPDLEAVAKDPSPVAATNALYLLLLGRTFALAETQSIHPLDLPEI
ncbi:MAG: hypothetical protein L6R35_006660, partial [Caloplaca aegaea]